MKGKRLIALLVVVLVLGSLVLACQPAAAPAPAPAPAPKPAPSAPMVEATNIKFGSHEHEGDYGVIFGDAFKEMVAEMSGGKITTQVFPLGTLGDCAEVNELTQSGELQITASAASWQSGFIKENNVFSLDYVLPSNRDALIWILRESDTAEKLEGLFRDNGFQYMGGSYIGWLWRTANKPMYKMEDWKDFKMRVMASPILVADYKALGANVTPLPFGEVYTGLQTGLIEGQENPLSTAINMKFYEVQQYVTQYFHRPFLYTHIANPAWWDSLNAETQRVVMLAFQSADDYAMDVYERRNIEAMTLLPQLRPDIVLYEMTSEELGPFKEAAKKAWDIYLDPAVGGPRAQEFVDSLQKDIAIAEGMFGK